MTISPDKQAQIDQLKQERTIIKERLIILFKEKEMANQAYHEKQTKIDQLKQERTTIKERLIILFKERLRILFKERELANQAYHEKRLKWASVKQSYEALDREIALMELSIRQASQAAKKTTKTSQEQKQIAARKALDALPPEVRAALFNDYQD
ncbi:MAG: hypothetical protein SVO01_00240 [Thermotogota bacterium]|nr:hypothetical protein [Thermotogota bacterium]